MKQNESVLDLNKSTEIRNLHIHELKTRFTWQCLQQDDTGQSSKDELRAVRRRTFVMRSTCRRAHSSHDDEIQGITRTVASPPIRPCPSVYGYRCNVIQSRTSRDGIAHRLRMLTGTKSDEEEQDDESESLIIGALTRGN